MVKKKQKTPVAVKVGGGEMTTGDSPILRCFGEKQEEKFKKGTGKGWCYFYTKSLAKCKAHKNSSRPG